MKIKTIHQIIGKRPSSLIRTCLSSWKLMDEFGYRNIYWTDKDLLEFVNFFYPFAFDAILKARNHAEAADIGRYLIIYHYGGIYCDWDIEIFMHKEYVNFLENYPEGYILYDQNGTIASEHFCANKDEAYLLEIIKDIVNIYESGCRGSFKTPLYSGPYRMQETFKRFPYSKQALLPVKDVFEYDYSEIRTAQNFGSKKFMVHYWDHSWVNKT